MQVHEKCYVCTHVFAGAPVLYVTRPDGDWCFLCGEEHPEDASAYRVVGVGHVLAADKSLTDVLDLQPDTEAERSRLGRPWARRSFEDGEDRG